MKKIHENHLKAALGEDVGRSASTTLKWLNYIQNRVTLPSEVSGIEAFPWEELYIMSFWDTKEYEELKKTNPSYSDVYDLVGLYLPEGNDTLIAEIVRISDQ